MSLNTSATYSRSDVAAMLSALSFEEKRWTLNYLVNILVVPPKNEAEERKHYKLADDVVQQARAMSVSGYEIPADEDGCGAIADFKYLTA